jgi:hypothetical protein
MFEAESGLTINEPGTLAVKATVEAAVVELIKEGERKGVWDFKKEAPPVVQAPTVIEPVKPAPVVEAKKEEPKKVDPVATAETKEIAKKLEPLSDKKLGPETKLLVNSYLYKEPHEKSTRMWWLGAGTNVVINPVEGDWVAVVVAGDGKRGFVRRSSLVAK